MRNPVSGHNKIEEFIEESLKFYHIHFSHKFMKIRIILFIENIPVR